jgi:hypothetical protein
LAKSNWLFLQPRSEARGPVWLQARLGHTDLNVFISVAIPRFARDFRKS